MRTGDPRLFRARVTVWKENGHPVTCPHCGAGADGVTLGLFWDFDEHCWRCLMCGYRQYKRAKRPRTKADIVAERIWDEVLEAIDKEENKELAVRCQMK